MRRATTLIISCLVPIGCAGCDGLYQMIVDRQPRGDRNAGAVFYIGGAGPIGNVGSFDVPAGLRDAGYRGLVEVFAWQSWTHAGDQVNLPRNREKAADLAAAIKRYRRRYPKPPIHIIALSAGTGIATFALEYLPESTGIENVVFMGCSMSSTYDLTRALKRIRGKLYVLYSEHDMMLKDVVWFTGTIDRSSAAEGIAGLEGFYLPASRHPDTLKQYEKVQAIAYRPEFSTAGYKGGHTGGTSPSFVRRYLAPPLMGDDHRLLGNNPERRFTVNPPMRPTTSPTSKP
jgi:pimeloyl-ACP methyl ester carboxylesterase